MMKMCTGSGWDRINFIHSRCFGAVFWIYTGNRDVFAAEQGLLRAKAFTVPRLTPPARGLGMHKELGGDTVRTADPSDSRDILHCRTSSSAYKNGGRLVQGCCLGTSWPLGSWQATVFIYIPFLSFISLCCFLLN